MSAIPSEFDAAAFAGPFDPVAYVAAYRRLGASIWFIRDTRTGEEEVRGSYPLYPPKGMSDEEFHRQTTMLMHWAKTDPNAMAKVSAVVKGEGVVHEYRSPYPGQGRVKLGRGRAA